MAKRPVLWSQFISWLLVFRSDRTAVNRTCGGGVLIALYSRVRSCKGRYVLKSCDECVWVEIPTFCDLILLIGNHYFPPGTKLQITANYFRFLEKTFDWLYSPCGPWPLFSFLIYSQSVGLLGRVINLSHGRYLNTEIHKHKINTYTHQTSMH
jgi:hypothetical protein